VTGQKVLLVENESVASDLKTSLGAQGYIVTLATTGEEAFAAASRLKPAVVLMDVALSGSLDGIEAGILIRQKLGIPLIFISVDSTDQTIERAAAADPAGYLVKPIDGRGLYASIQLAVHRGRLQAQKSGGSPNASSAISPRTSLLESEGRRPITVIGNLRIDPILQRVLRGSTQVHLTKKEFLILQCLAEHPGTPFSPQALLDGLWGPQFSHYIKALRIHVGHLRQKIQGNPPPGVVIETIRGVGYRLIVQD